MSGLKLNDSVEQWVAPHPQAAGVFEAMQVTRAVSGISDESLEDWLCASLSDLCNHIEQTHHALLKKELCRLTDLIAKNVGLYRESHPELLDLQQHFISLRTEMLPHIAREEDALFPAIRQLEQSKILPDDRIHSIAMPIRTLFFEHLYVADDLRSIRKAAKEFAAPVGVCDSYRDMIASLHRLELDTHHHIQKENQILFPRAIELESQRTGPTK